jgi:hypothetical protein
MSILRLYSADKSSWADFALQTNTYDRLTGFVNPLAGYFLPFTILFTILFFLPACDWKAGGMGDASISFNHTIREAAEEEWLESPCEITISRPGGFVGALVGQYVFLNGIRIGVLKNGGSLSFQTNVTHNILYCTDLAGAVFQDYRRFEAEPGGNESFSFNRKFL